MSDKEQYHEQNCNCPIVNPITTWIGGNLLLITAYQCPKCKKITKVKL